MEKKICSKCKIEKDVSLFNKRAKSVDGFRYECKECQKKDGILYRENNKNIIKEKTKDYKQKNKKLLNEKGKVYYKNNIIKENYRSKKYYTNNKKNIIERQKKYNKNKYENDFLFKLITNSRNRIYNFFKLKRIKKMNSTFDIIGCTPKYLKEHIENQFTTGMSWEKLGTEIHIDHIIPLSLAKTEEEVYKLCHYTNLQPLWAKDNLSKSSKIIPQ